MPTNPQRVDVERFVADFERESMRRATHDEGDEISQQYVEAEAYDALLQQLAAAETTAQVHRDICRGLGDKITELRAKLAERDAELETADRCAAGYRNTIQFMGMEICDLKLQVLAAERAMDEARAILQRIHASGYTTTGDYDVVAAFLAAPK